MYTLFPQDEEIRVYGGGRGSVDTLPLEQNEEDAIRAAYGDALRMISSRLDNATCAFFRKQEQHFVAWGEVAKAHFFSNDWGTHITYPPKHSMIGVVPLVPKILAHDADPETLGFGYRNPIQIPVTEGVPCHLFGGSSVYTEEAMYCRTPPGVFAVVAQNGIIETGPDQGFFEGIRVRTEAYHGHGVVTYPPYVEAVPDMPRVVGLQPPDYPQTTVAQLPLWSDFGVDVTLYPAKTGLAKIGLFGLAFVEWKKLGKMGYV